MWHDLAAIWNPPPPAKCRDWIPEHVVIPAETETPGPFDLDLFPHVAEVLDTIDDPTVRRVYLMWAARNAKTTTALAALLFFSVNMPRPSLFCSSNEEKADDTIGAQFLPMIEACRPARELLLPRQNKRAIKFRHSRIRRAFSGSPSTLAGFPACYGVGNEVSKWSRNKSSEAAPVFLFSQRFKLFPFDSKEIFEGTPGKLGDCTITELINRPGTDRRRRYVPCPHCGLPQQLVFGHETFNDPHAPGVRWKKNRHNKSEPARAEETAYYQCVNGCKIYNEDRAMMMRAGLWLSEGLSIDIDHNITGEPVVPESSSVGFCDLSSLYSLVISGWGQIARDWLDTVGNREARRDFLNSTLCLPWDDKPKAIEPHELAERLCNEIPAGIVPAWGLFLTCGIDVQEHAGRFVYTVCAWGRGARGAEIDHGECDTFADLVAQVLLRKYQHADEGLPLGVHFSLIDSGHETEHIYSLWRAFEAQYGRRLLPCKGQGSQSKLNTEYKAVRLAPEQRRNKHATGDVMLIEINTHTTQTWIQHHIDGEINEEMPAFELSQTTGADIAYLEQLLNECLIEEIDDKGYPKKSWNKRNENQPNDDRDALRYAKTAATVATRNGKLWATWPLRNAKAPTKQQPQHRPLTMPDGRPFLITER